MLDQINEVLESMMDDPKFFGNIAKMMKRLHDELVAVGFTSEQACRIIANFKATGS